MTKLTWSGRIPSQKWMTFYTKVLTGLVNAGDLTLTVAFESSPTGGLSPQRVETIKAALRDLGLTDSLNLS